MACSIVMLGSGNKYGHYGDELMQRIRQNFYLPDSHLYAESFENNKPSGPCFNWAGGVLLTALTAASAYDAKYKPILREYADAMEVYWNPAGPVAGFDVLPMPKPVDRYYDDNEWMVLGLAETAVVLKDPKYFLKARAALKFALSGMDDKLGGGIYWRESDKASKNTCSNAPAATGLLELHRISPKEGDVDTAKAIYDWTHVNLRDPESGLYWDNKTLDGKIGKATWSYNTALMIRAATGLFLATKDEKYAEQARQAEGFSVDHWFIGDGEMPDEGKFAHLLLDAWLERFEYAPRRQEVAGSTSLVLRVLDHLHGNLRDSNGFYPSRWDRKNSDGGKRVALIDQASAARAFFAGALWVKEHRTVLSGPPSDEQ